MVPANSDRVPRAPPYSGYPYDLLNVIHTRLSRSVVYLSKYFRFHLTTNIGSYNPHIAVTIWVWANPISLATTLGITFVFFSSAYLDVSVQRVRLL